MKRRTGPRPPAIRWFAGLFVLAAILSLFDGLSGLDAPNMTDSIRDATIIGSSARFTIALMTTGLVWFFALRLARWMVPAFLLTKIAATLVLVVRAGSFAFVSPLWLAAMALGVIAAAMLFAPSARPWFARPGQRIDDVFA
ncbi:hypothetical protein ACWPMX_13745 [Tsuneonella sp. HG094]